MDHWRDGTSRLDALNAQPFGFSVYAKPFLKRVIEYGNGETKVEYSRLNTEKGTYAHWLNCVTSISYNRYKQVMEVECNECTSKLFVDMIKSICNISEQVKSFINPKEMKTVFDLSRDEIVALTDEEISLYIDKELAGKGIPIEAKNWNIKNEKEVVYPDCGVPIFVIKDIGVGFRKIEDATEVANLLVGSRAFKVNSKYLNRSYERLNVINEGVVPAVEGCVGYTNEEFERVNKENNDPESEKIGSFNKTVEEANNIRSRVLKYVDKIKQERAYNIDLCMTFERYIEIADKDAERAMAFLKEAYPFNEETEVFIRKRYNMSIGVDPEEN